MRGDPSFTISGRLSAGLTRLEPDAAHDIYRAHGLPYWTLNLTVAGIGRVDGAGPRLLTHPGDILLFEPGVLNDYGREETQCLWHHCWSVFQPEESWFHLLTWPMVLPGILRLDLADGPLFPRVRALFDDLIVVSHGGLAQRDELGMALLHTILVWCDTVNPASAHRRLDPRVQKAMDHMHRHPERPHGLDSLARVAGMSPSRLAHRFRTEVGQPPLTYLERVRIDRACELLLMSGRPVADIGSAVGYLDPGYFTRVFRKHLQMTPRAYRRSRHSP